MARLKQQRLGATLGENRAVASNLPAPQARFSPKAADNPTFNPATKPPDEMGGMGGGKYTGKYDTSGYNPYKTTQPPTTDAPKQEPVKSGNVLKAHKDFSNEMHHYTDATGVKKTVDVGGLSKTQKAKMQENMKGKGYEMESSGMSNMPLAV